MTTLRVRKLVYSALYLAIALVLPFITGQIPEIGSMLCPMHIPALLCGFMCGWPWGLAVGFIAPLLRSALFGMPVPKFLIANTDPFVYNIEAVTLIAMMRKVVVISGRYEVSRVFTRSECQLKPTTSHCTESSVIAEMTRAIHSVAL